MDDTSRMAIHDAESASRLPQLSFVSPVYGSPDSLKPLCDAIAAVCAKLGVTYEIILVDDRCPNDSWSRIEELTETRREVCGIRLSRNFGQHSAIHAGLEFVRGEWIVVLDCDLQDDPEVVPLLLEKTREHYDIVRARRTSRHDSYFRRLASQSFYRLLGYLTDTNQEATIGNFGVYHHRVIDAVVSWDEEHKFFPVIIQWVGFRQAVVDVPHSHRHSGHSSYHFGKLLRLGINVAISFSDKPLRLIVGVGAIISLLALLFGIVVLFRALFGGIAVPGWTSITLSIWFLSGVIITVTGISGLYIGRILAEAKRRPTYIVDEVRPARDRRG
jgi:glycosyltransferase involved in cell wall biosynthesis